MNTVKQVDKEEIRQKTEMKTEPASVIKYQDDTKNCHTRNKICISYDKDKNWYHRKGSCETHIWETFPGYREKGLRYEDDDSEDEQERLTRTDLIDKWARYESKW